MSVETFVAKLKLLGFTGIVDVFNVAVEFYDGLYENPAKVIGEIRNCAMECGMKEIPSIKKKGEAFYSVYNFCDESKMDKALVQIGLLGQILSSLDGIGKDLKILLERDAARRIHDEKNGMINNGWQPVNRGIEKWPNGLSRQPVICIECNGEQKKNINGEYFCQRCHPERAAMPKQFMRFSFVCEDCLQVIETDGRNWDCPNCKSGGKFAKKANNDFHDGDK